MNPDPDAIEAPLAIKGAKRQQGVCFANCQGADPMIYNDPGKPPKVAIVESQIQGTTDGLMHL